MDETTGVSGGRAKYTRFAPLSPQQSVDVALTGERNQIIETEKRRKVAKLIRDHVPQAEVSTRAIAKAMGVSPDTTSRDVSDNRTKRQKKDKENDDAVSDDRTPSISGTKAAKTVERRIDQMRQEQEQTVGLATGKEGKRKSLGVPATPSDRPTLAEAGIDKHLAQRMRALLKS